MYIDSTFSTIIIFFFFLNRQLLQLMETPSPFSVSVFNDMVFWSDTKKRTIQKAHKVTGKRREVLLKRPGQPLGLKVGAFKDVPYIYQVFCDLCKNV